MKIRPKKLYVNIKYSDLESILETGLCPTDVSNGHKKPYATIWQDRTDVVYLFEQMNDKTNSIPEQGIVLLEITTDRAIENWYDCTILEDKFIEKFRKYVANYIPASEIKKIIIPKIYKDLISVNDKRIKFCKVKADIKDPNEYNVFHEIDNSEISDLISRRGISLNEFVGKDENNHPVFFHNVKYLYK